MRRPPWLWPIEGTKAGDNILCRPQELVDNESNSEKLIVSAPEGTVVVAPFDGIFGGYSVTYRPALSSSLGWAMKDDSKSIDEWRDEILASRSFDRSYNPKYLTGSVRIRTAAGNAVNIQGFPAT